MVSARCIGRSSHDNHILGVFELNDAVGHDRLGGIVIAEQTRYLVHRTAEYGNGIRRWTEAIHKSGHIGGGQSRSNAQRIARSQYRT